MNWLCGSSHLWIAVIYDRAQHPQPPHHPVWAQAAQAECRVPMVLLLATKARTVTNVWLGTSSDVEHLKKDGRLVMMPIFCCVEHITGIDVIPSGRYQGTKCAWRSIHVKRTKSMELLYSSAVTVLRPIQGCFQWAVLSLELSRYGDWLVLWQETWGLSSVSPAVSKICCTSYYYCCLLQLFALTKCMIFSLATFLLLALISAFTVL